MDEKQIKKLISAIVVHFEFQGCRPSWGAYQDRAEEMEAELEQTVNEIYEDFKSEEN